MAFPIIVVGNKLELEEMWKLIEGKVRELGW